MSSVAQACAPAKPLAGGRGSRAEGEEGLNTLPPRSPKGGRPSREIASRLGEHILQTALREFTARGFEATSMDAIVQAASISKRTLYARFASKEDLLAATLDFGVSRHLTAVRDAPVQGTVRQRLADITRRILTNSLSGEGMGFLLLLAWAARSRPELHRRVRDQARGDAGAVIRRILEDAHARGEISGADLDSAAATVFDLLITIPYYRVLNGEMREGEPIDEAQLGASVDFVMRALRVAP